MRQFGKFGPLIGAIDAGTSNVKFLVFAAKTSEVLTYHQTLLRRFSPQEGWVEQDPLEIYNAVLECIEVTADNLKKLDINPEDIVGIGIANQRETSLIWNSVTGQPLYSAIVWLDVRTSKIVDDLINKCGLQTANAVKETSGLPLSTYFSSVKLRWLLQNVSAVKDALKAGTCMAGTVDTWIIWNLTGGKYGGIHVTDVTNASRTQLMSLKTLQWDKRLLRFFDIPIQILPTIKSSSEIYGYIRTGSLSGVPIAGCLGDQQAALVGQNCMRFGQVKCTFGTGCFLLYNTGESIVHSGRGLLTTVACQLGPGAPPVYALEGSVAVAGDCVDWLRDGLEILGDVKETESLAATVEDEGNIHFVPAFNGLFSPHWRKDARGMMIGVTGNTRREHIVRAAFEAVCQQVRAAAGALAADCAPLRRLLADGGMAQNATLMQMAADVLGVPVIRPLMTESTALGAAAAAGRALGVWPPAPARAAPPADSFLPAITDEEREIRRERWEQALNRSLGWAAENKDVSVDVDPGEIDRTTAVLPSGLFFLGTALLVIIADKLKSIS